jgi:hypothetical protein
MASSCAHASSLARSTGVIAAQLTTGADELTLTTHLVHRRKHHPRLEGWRVKLDTPDAAFTSGDANLVDSGI